MKLADLIHLDYKLLLLLPRFGLNLGFRDQTAEECCARVQVRVTTPARAREIGSDYIVVGRPVTGADDPVAAYRRCVAEFLGSR